MLSKYEINPVSHPRRNSVINMRVKLLKQANAEIPLWRKPLLFPVVRTEKIGRSLLPSNLGKMIQLIRVLQDFEGFSSFALSKADQVTSQNHTVTAHRKAPTDSNSVKSGVAKKLQN